MQYDLPPPPIVIQADIPSMQVLGSMIKFPPGGGDAGADVAYTDLVCTDQDRANIAEIITTMAENNKLSLLMKQSHLRQLGAQIHHVHPLKFLAIVFTSDRLTDCMFDIFDDYFKRNGFLEGLGPSLTKEAEKGTLDKYAQDFAAEVDQPLEKIQKHFKSRDWDAFCRFLMNE